MSLSSGLFTFWDVCLSVHYFLQSCKVFGSDIIFSLPPKSFRTAFFQNHLPLLPLQLWAVVRNKKKQSFPDVLQIRCLKSHVLKSLFHLCWSLFLRTPLFTEDLRWLLLSMTFSSFVKVSPSVIACGTVIQNHKRLQEYLKAVSWRSSSKTLLLKIYRKISQNS